MKPSEIVRRRLRAQRLWGAPAAPKGAGAAAAVDVVRHLLAVQSQEAAAAKFSIGARAGGVVTADVDAALDAGRLVRTHVLRPTWHTVAAEDLRWLLRLTAPRVRQLSAFMMRKLHIDERLLARTNAALRQALAKNNAMTRDELAALLGIDGPPLTYVLQHAELEAVICSGPERPRGTRGPGQGRQQTWALVDDRVAAGTAEVDVDGAAAVARLVDRFFRTRGPATVKDCATWCTLRRRR